MLSTHKCKHDTDDSGRSFVETEFSGSTEAVCTEEKRRCVERERNSNQAIVSTCSKSDASASASTNIEVFPEHSKLPSPSIEQPQSVLFAAPSKKLAGVRTNRPKRTSNVRHSKLNYCVVPRQFKNRSNLSKAATGSSFV